MLAETPVFFFLALAKKQQIPILVFGLNRPGLEPTIYHNRDNYANHYTVDAVGCSRQTQGSWFVSCSLQQYLSCSKPLCSVKWMKREYITNSTNILQVRLIV